MRLLAGNKGRLERKGREQEGANLYPANAATASRIELEMRIWATKVQRIEEKEGGGGRKVDGARLKQGREYFDQRSDKDTEYMWKGVKLERD